MGAATLSKEQSCNRELLLKAYKVRMLSAFSNKETVDKLVLALKERSDQLINSYDTGNAETQKSLLNDYQTLYLTVTAVHCFVLEFHKNDVSLLSDLEKLDFKLYMGKNKLEWSIRAAVEEVLSYRDQYNDWLVDHLKSKSIPTPTFQSVPYFAVVEDMIHSLNKIKSDEDFKNQIDLISNCIDDTCHILAEKEFKAIGEGSKRLEDTEKEINELMTVQKLLYCRKKLYEMGADYPKVDPDNKKRFLDFIKNLFDSDPLEQLWLYVNEVKNDNSKKPENLEVDAQRRCYISAKLYLEFFGEGMDETDRIQKSTFFYSAIYSLIKCYKDNLSQLIELGVCEDLDRGAKYLASSIANIKSINLSELDCLLLHAESYKQLSAYATTTDDKKQYMSQALHCLYLIERMVKKKWPSLDNELALRFSVLENEIKLNLNEINWFIERNALKTEVANYQGKTRTLTVDVQRLLREKGDFNDLVATVERLTSQCAAMELDAKRTAEKYKKILEEAKKKHQEKNRRITDDNEALEKKCNLLSEKVNELNTACAQLNEQLSQANRELSEYGDIVNVLQTALNEANNAVTALNQALLGSANGHDNQTQTEDELAVKMSALNLVSKTILELEEEATTNYLIEVPEEVYYRLRMARDIGAAYLSGSAVYLALMNKLQPNVTSKPDDYDYIVQKGSDVLLGKKRSKREDLYLDGDHEYRVCDIKDLNFPHCTALDGLLAIPTPEKGILRVLDPHDALKETVRGRPKVLRQDTLEVDGDPHVRTGEDVTVGFRYISQAIKTGKILDDRTVSAMLSVSTNTLPFAVYTRRVNAIFSNGLDLAFEFISNHRLTQFVFPFLNDDILKISSNYPNHYDDFSVINSLFINDVKKGRFKVDCDILAYMLLPLLKYNMSLPNQRGLAHEINQTLESCAGSFNESDVFVKGMSASLEKIWSLLQQAQKGPLVYTHSRHPFNSGSHSGDKGGPSNLSASSSTVTGYW